MPTDQQVSARAVLAALTELRRVGVRLTLRQLEQVEPDLTDHLLETLFYIHRNLLALGGPARQSQRLFRDIQSLTLVCIIALRRGHYELWRDSEIGGQLESDSDAPVAPDTPDTPEPPETDGA
jgi:hypothetical protein